MQVLAKEIKSLRASQMEVKQEAKQAMQAKVAMEVRIAQHSSDVHNFLSSFRKYICLPGFCF